MGRGGDGSVGVGHPERIAKWIGHSSATITSDTYNRLQEHEIHSLVRLPLVAESSTGTASVDPQREWRDLSRFLQDPYAADPCDWRRSMA